MEEDGMQLNIVGPTTDYVEEKKPRDVPVKKKERSTKEVNGPSKKRRTENGNHHGTPKRLKPIMQFPQIQATEKKASLSKANTKETNVFNEASYNTFEDFGLSDRLLNCIKEKLNLSTPTLIQKLGVGSLLHTEQDVLIKAETGSGKTLTYLIPIIEKLQKLSIQQKIHREDGTYSIVIAPTRELCLQINTALSKLVNAFPWIVPGVVMGGEKKKSEKARLRKGVSILVATPGRLLDHLKTTHSFRVDNLRYLVLDEADRLLDMGFEKDVTSIVSMLRDKVRVTKRSQFQSILISATLQEDIQRLAGQNLSNPKYITTDDVKPANEKSKKKKNGEEKEKVEGENGEESKEQFKAPRQLHQYYVTVPCKERLIALSAFLRWKAHAIENCKMILFFSNCDSVDFHYALFTQALIPSSESIKGEEEKPKKKGKEKEEKPKEPLFPLPIYRLHGNLKQVDRTKIYMDFNKAKTGVLLCTDVAARGMDFPGIDWIVQYDPPGETREYIHRIGRTARVGRLGNSLLFLLPTESNYIQLLNEHQIQVKEVFYEDMKGTLISPEKNIDGASALQLHYERMLLSDKELAGLGRRGFSSYVRAYSTHSRDTKHIFHVKNLHLGHVAKTFGLREQPKEAMAHQHKRLKVEGKKEREDLHDREAQVKAKKSMKVSTRVASEFGAGF